MMRGIGNYTKVLEGYPVQYSSGLGRERRAMTDIICGAKHDGN